MRNIQDHRYRQRGNREPGSTSIATTQVVTSAPTVVIHNSTSSIPGFYKKHESITDVCGNIQGYFNPCKHSELLYVNTHNVSSFTYDHPGGTRQVAWSTLYPLHPAGLEQYLETVLNSQNLPWLDDFSAKAEHHFITAVDPTINIVEFLTELIQMCTGNIRALKEASGKVTRALARFSEALRGDPGRFWLAWNFAIKPLIRDVRDLLTVLKRARKRLKWLKNHNHKSTIVKYREGVKDLPPIDPIFIQIPTDGVPVDELLPVFNLWFEGISHADLQFEIVIDSAETRPAAHAEVVFDIPDHLLEGDMGLGIVWAYLNGLYDPLGTAWELVPFTWLIDWFVSERTKLESERRRVIGPLPNASLGQCMHSFQTRVFGHVNLHIVEASGTTTFEIGHFRYQNYSRVKDLPSTEGSDLVLPDTWYQLSIILALASRKRRR